MFKQFSKKKLSMFSYSRVFRQNVWFLKNSLFMCTSISSWAVYVHLLRHPNMWWVSRYFLANVKCAFLNVLRTRQNEWSIISDSSFQRQTHYSTAHFKYTHICIDKQNPCEKKVNECITQNPISFVFFHHIIVLSECLDRRSVLNTIGNRLSAHSHCAVVLPALPLCGSVNVMLSWNQRSK